MFGNKNEESLSNEIENVKVETQSIFKKNEKNIKKLSFESKEDVPPFSGEDGWRYFNQRMFCMQLWSFIFFYLPLSTREAELAGVEKVLRMLA